MEPIQPNFTQPVSPSPAPVTPGTHWKMLGSIAGIAVLVGVGAYALLGRSYDVAEMVPTYTPREDSTAGLKTYTDTQYGFEFKYPADWKPNSSQTSFNIIDPTGSVLSTNVFSIELGKTYACVDMDDIFSFGDIGDIQAKKCYIDRPAGIWRISLSNPNDITKEFTLTCWGPSDCAQILSTFKFTSPTTSCTPRPACLDATPRCLPPEPAEGWCPQ